MGTARAFVALSGSCLQINVSLSPMVSLHNLFVVRMSHPACNWRVSNLCGGGPSDPIVASRSPI